MIYVYVCMLEDYEGPSVTTESAMHKIRNTRREDCMRLYFAFVLPALDGRFAHAYQYTYVHLGSRNLHLYASVETSIWIMGDRAKSQTQLDRRFQNTS